MKSQVVSLASYKQALENSRLEREKYQRNLELSMMTYQMPTTIDQPYQLLSPNYKLSKMKVTLTPIKS